MPEIIIRPSMKLIRAAYTVVWVIIFLAVLAYTNSDRLQQVTPWVLLLPALLFAVPLKGHLQRRFTRMILDDGKLRYQTGILNKSTRTIQVFKVQDVRVDQTLAQRVLGTGDISIETAGETSLLTMRNIDAPDRVADLILRSASTRPKKGKQE